MLTGPTQCLSGHFFLSRFQLCTTNLKTGPIKILPCPIISFHLRSLPALLIYVAQLFNFLAFCTFAHVQQSKEMFSKDMLKKWNAPQACFQPLISLFQFSWSSLSYNLVPHSTHPSSKCTYTHTIFGYNCINTACSLSSREHCCPISLSWWYFLWQT